MKPGHGDVLLAEYQSDLREQPAILDRQHAPDELIATADFSKVTASRLYSAALEIFGDQPVDLTLGHPVVAWAQFAAVMWATHFSGFFEAAVENPWLHALEHGLFLGSAALFWWPALGESTGRWRLSHPLRLLYVALAMPQNTFLAVAILSSKRICLYGAGREGLALRGFAMRLFHMGRDAHVVADMTTPPIGPYILKPLEKNGSRLPRG